MADNPNKEKPWWRSTRFRIGIILAVAVGLIILGYWLPYPWIGFDSAVTPKPDDVDYRPMRTIWDWLGLLIIPAALGVGGLLFSRAEREVDHEIATERAKNEQKIADERIRDSILREYLDRMSVLLIEHKLATSEKDSPVRYVARARTLTLLNALAGDGPRKGSVVQFLYEAGLINREASVVRLAGADLSDADLSDADLNEADLSEANLVGAKLVWAKLVGAKLVGAKLNRAVLRSAKLGEAKLNRAVLINANLIGANMIKADLSDAYLINADLSEAYLNRADLNNAKLIRADLNRAKLGEAYLNSVDLTDAKLIKADLNRADLREAKLIRADLSRADLSGADLRGAELGWANLSWAMVLDEQLREARSLYEAVMPDGSQHE
jgi:uncharacterized protein YjbI with pentapeptide repeats